MGEIYIYSFWTYGLQVISEMGNSWPPWPHLGPLGHLGHLGTHTVVTQHVAHEGATICSYLVVPWSLELASSDRAGDVVPWVGRQRAVN